MANVTLKQLLDDTHATVNKDSYQSRRVSVKGLTVDSIDYSKSSVVSQDGSTMNIYRIPTVDGLKVGDVIDVIAVVSMHYDIQLRINSVSDISFSQIVPPTVTPTVAPTATPTPTPTATPTPTTTPTVTPIPVGDDPISADMVGEGVNTIDEIYALTTTGGTATVIGQVLYQYGNYNNINTTIIGYVINGEIYGFQVYDALSSYKYNAGDIITVTGKVSDYGKVRQIQNITASALVKAAAETSSTIPAQEVTIAEINNNLDKYISELVVIKNVTLGAYSSTASTMITDEAGQTLPIYRAATYPESVSEGSKVDLTAIASRYNATIQLRVGNQASYKLAGAYDVNEDVIIPIASFSGSAAPTETTVYADLNAPNDYLDTASYLTLSTGKAPAVNKTNIGSTGLADGAYYLITTGSKQLASLDMSFLMKGSKTGARDFAISYSTDEINFTNEAIKVNTAIKYTQYGAGGATTDIESNVDTADGTFSLVVDGKYHTVTVKLPDKAANADKLYIKVAAVGTTSIKGETIGTSGTNYFTDIKLSGNPIVADDICQAVALNVQDGVAAAGETIELTTGTKDATIYYSYNGSEFALYDVANKPVYTEFPAKIVAYASKAGLNDSIKASFTVAQAQVATVKANPNGGAVNVGTSLKLTCVTPDAKIMYSFDGENYLEYNGGVTLAALPATVYVKAIKTGYLDSAVVTLNFTLRENAEYNIYFGQIHSHTTISDGAGTLEDAFNYAYNKAEHLDFIAVTDHSNSFDNDTSANISDGSASPEWVNAKKYAKEFTANANDFVALYGYEMTWSGGTPGHMNTYNTEGFLSRNMNGYKNASAESLPNYYTALKTVPDSISMFNHPGTTFGDFEDFAHYDEEIDALITLIEVGNGEGAIGSSGYFPSYSYYTRALDKGWHIAPANNQDNHKGLWGDANTGRTVILADTLTEDSIYDAIRNMRVYATEDNDFELIYKLNGADMGTIFEDAQDEVEINVSVKDPTDTNKDAKVEVIVNGGIVAANGTIAGSNGNIKFNLTPDYAYYYIRIVQADGDIIVSAPVWIAEVEAIGISSVTTSAPLPVKGEALDITTTFFNNEKLPLTINSIKFMIDEEVIHEVKLAEAGLTTLEALGTKEYTFSYTHNGLGNTEIKAVLDATYDGVQKNYVGQLKLGYVDPSMVTRIIIDGTHKNDYVSGYYGGNTKNISKLAAQSSMQISVPTDKITKEMLENCNLLIITAPGKKTDYGVSHFEDSFIEMVKEYVNNGGDVIVCGIADYQDTADGQTTTEINKLLAAIGATTKLNADEAYDEVKNGGQAYRLYPSIFNFDSPYTQGIIHGNADETANQTYSAYSGCTVALDEAAVAAGKATWLVKGFDTTYSVSTKTFAGLPGGNAVVVNKGDVVFLAHEKLNSGSNVFVSGSVFMSDFEVKELDSAADLPYANQNIILNILDEIQTEVPISTIAQMRQGNFGDIFAIEGYVTAGTAVEGNAFFDTIYVQDATGGTTVFPFAEPGLELGTKIRIIGSVDGYQGDKEIMVISYEILDDENLNVIEPTAVTTAQAADYEALGGQLLQVEGKVTKIVTNSAGVDYFYVVDESGVEARVFVDGYILASNGVDKVNDIVKVGNTVKAVGLSYFNPDGACLRVRDRAEIVLISEAVVEPEDGGNTDITPPVIVPIIPTEPTVTPEPETQNPEETTPEETIPEENIPEEKTPEGEASQEEEVVLKVKKTVNAEKNAVIKDSIKELMSNDEELDAVAAVTEAMNQDDASASLSIGVRKIENIAVGDTVYVYRYNPETEKYEELVNGTCTVGKGKKVNLEVADDGIYVATNKQLDASVVTTVKQQIADEITVAGKNKATLNTADKAKCKIKVALPENIAAVVNEDELTVTYKSYNKNIATVTKNGTIKAKAAGTVKVKVTVKLNGVVISTKTIKVTVK